jgi:hypothetical protein
MAASILPLALVITGGVAYHLGQKAAGGGNLWRVLVIAYGAAFAVSLVLWLLSPGAARPLPLARAELGAAVMVGLAALAIEAGFFLAYRAGWAVGTTSLLSSVACSALLALLGFLVYGESFGAARAGGVALASLGAFFIVRG